MSKRSDYMNPLYVNKEKRDELGFLSMICFGSKGKWRKLALRLGLDVENIENQMREIINIREKQREEMNERLNKKGTSTTQGSTTAAGSNESGPEQTTTTHDTVDSDGIGSQSVDVRRKKV